jgi:predicted DNA-binding antitoxin AbrB/MazE fold protein
MLAYKKYVTIKDPENLVLKKLPFRSGQRVEIVMIAEDEKKKISAQDLRKLFKKTQKLPKVKAISESQIAEEIKIYRTNN